MVKFLVGLIIVALLAFIGYHRFSEEPLTPRRAIEVGIDQVRKTTKLEPAQEQLLRVQLAITDYTATKGRPPASLKELVPQYFDSEPKDPLTNNPYPYTVEHNIPKLGAQVGATQVASHAEAGQKDGNKDGKKGQVPAPVEEFVNPNTMQLDDFVYDKTGKRDPFEPFDLSAAPETGPGGSLTAYTLGQLRLTAVIVGPTGERKGIVEDDQGRGYTVSTNTPIGNEGGVVVSVEPNMLKVVVAKRDFTGKETQNVIEMKINQSGPSGKGKGRAKEKKRK